MFDMMVLVRVLCVAHLRLEDIREEKVKKGMGFCNEATMSTK